LAVYNSEFVLGSACVGSEDHPGHKSVKKSVTYLTLIILIVLIDRTMTNWNDASAASELLWVT